MADNEIGAEDLEMLRRIRMGTTTVEDADRVQAVLIELAELKLAMVEKGQRLAYIVIEEAKRTFADWAAMQRGAK